MIDEIFHNLYTKQGLPILFSDEVLQRIQIDFCQYHASVAEMVLQLKMALAHHFTKRGEIFVSWSGVFSGIIRVQI